MAKALVLPQYVAFKGDNGKYLSARWIEGHKYLQFASDDNRDPTVGNEVVTLDDGRVRIKNIYFGEFWRCSPNWVWADSNDSTPNDVETLYFVEQVEQSIITLRSAGNNKFCGRYSADGKKDCLNAAVTTSSPAASLKVEGFVGNTVPK